MQRSTTVLTATVLLVLISASNLRAQWKAPDLTDQVIRIRAGQQILGPNQRVSIASRVGTLLETRGDTLVLDPLAGGDIERFLLGDMTVVERREPTTAERSGTLVGGLAGAALVGLAMYAHTEPEYRPNCESWAEAFRAAILSGPECPLKETNLRKSRAVIGVAVGTLLGGLLGKSIGADLERERWVPIFVEHVAVAVGVEPVGRSWGPTVRLGF